MNCDEVEERIEQLINNELDWSVAEKMKTHIDRCSSCEEILSSQQAVALLRDCLPPLSPSADTNRVVMSAFLRAHAQEKSKGHSAWSPWQMFTGVIKVPKPAFGGAALMLLVLVAIAFLAGRWSASDLKLTVPVVDSNALPVAIEKPSRTNVGRTSTGNLVTKSINPSKRRLPKRGGGVGRPPRLFDVTVNNSIAENAYITQTSLTHFQPVSTITLKVVKEKDKR